RCSLCPRECVVPPDGRGHCGVRENRDGVYYTLTYGNPCAVHVDPIEKKPFYHFLPTTTAFSIATAGCNLDCKFCQNWQISQSRPEDLRSYDLPPSRLVDAALESGAPSIAYTYSEPTVFYEYMLDCAKLAREEGLRNVYHSNGYISEAPLRELCAYLDAANIDLKGMSDEYYREMAEGTLEPVLRTLRILREEGVHVEITTLVVPGRNDSPDMIRRECEWIRENLGADVPLHFSRFHPQHKLTDLPPTPIETLERARAIALDSGLRYVYIGNVPGHQASHTYCPECGSVLIRRVGYSVETAGFEDGRCRECGAPIPGVYGGK
ncbi:MAG: AmmeMemoRadiSam system radical SAM enzyme, partial [Candidatus Eisenbacteria bacterium]|nr:AmmeMemoRadiSam system radical SAM enzyme [Candidatus Eisenbacteria bacterium]